MLSLSWLFCVEGCFDGTKENTVIGAAARTVSLSEAVVFSHKLSTRGKQSVRSAELSEPVSVVTGLAAPAV